MDTTSAENAQSEAGPEEKQIGVFKKARAVMCHHCPFCNHARKKPGSMLGKLMHHKSHADNCPMWKAEKEVYGES